MDDLKAKEVLKAVLDQNPPGDENEMVLTMALRHALLAFEDREALVEEYRTIGYNAVVERAKTHMGRVR